MFFKKKTVGQVMASFITMMSELEEIEVAQAAEIERQNDLIAQAQAAVLEAQHERDEAIKARDRLREIVGGFANAEPIELNGLQATPELA